MAYVPVLAGQTLTADLLNTRIVEETMAWTPLSSIGTFATNFSEGSAIPRMRKLMILGTEVWEYEGRINCASGSVPATTTTMFTFNVGHRVVTEQEFATGASQSAHYPVRLGFMASGTLTASVPTAAGTTTSVVWLTGVRITNPV